MKNRPQDPSPTPHRRKTLTDLARELEVDTSTISLALRDSPKISRAMKEKVHKLATRRGYVPNAHARALAGGRSSLLGVVQPCAGIPFYSTMLDLLHEEAARHGLRVVAQFHQWDQERELSVIRSMVEQRVEGIVNFSSLENPPKILPEELFRNTGTPISFWGRQPPATHLPNYIRGFVSTDVRLGAKLATEHLLNLGHRRFALFLLFQQRRTRDNEKMKGIREAMKSFPDAELIPVYLPKTFSSSLSGAALTFACAEQVAREFLRLAPLPTAVITTDDTAAQVLMAFLRAEGLRVPEDVSIAASGNTYYSRYGAVPLSCVDVPLELIAEKLVGLVTGPPIQGINRTYFIPPRFTVRASTAAAPCRKLRRSG